MDCKKILNHLDLPACASHADKWDVKRKPSPRANSPPTESFIIYDECSSPGADDYIIDADYPMETCLSKNPAAGKAVGYARICLNPQFRLQKSILTTDPAFVIWMGIGFFELMPQYMGPQLMPIHNSHFSVIRTEKAMSYLSVIFRSTHILHKALKRWPLR